MDDNPVKWEDRQPGPSPARIQQKERQRRALELRKAGATYQQIADQLGYANAQGAGNAVRRALQDTIREPTEDFRSLQMERLNHMLLVLSPGVQGGDGRSIQLSLQVMDAMNRLAGAEQMAPLEINHSHVLKIEGDSESYIRRLQMMAGERQFELPQDTAEVVDVEVDVPDEDPSTG